MPDEPIAFLLTWTCYGTWLHGDERGSVDDDHGRRGQPFAPFNPVRETVRARQLKHDPYHLEAARRGVVHKTILEVCNHRGWTCKTLNVRTNHVHAVISHANKPGKAMSDLKAWCTRRLREAKLLDKTAPAWAEGGSVKWIWTDEQLDRVGAYVRDGQGDDLPMG